MPPSPSIYITQQGKNRSAITADIMRFMVSHYDYTTINMLNMELYPRTVSLLGKTRVSITWKGDY